MLQISYGMCTLPADAELSVASLWGAAEVSACRHGTDYCCRVTRWWLLVTSGRWPGQMTSVEVPLRRCQSASRECRRTSPRGGLAVRGHVAPSRQRQTSGSTPRTPRTPAPCWRRPIQSRAVAVWTTLSWRRLGRRTGSAVGSSCFRCRRSPVLGRTAAERVYWSTPANCTEMTSCCVTSCPREDRTAARLLVPVTVQRSL